MVNIEHRCQKIFQLILLYEKNKIDKSWDLCLKYFIHFTIITNIVTRELVFIQMTIQMMTFTNNFYVNIKNSNTHL
jgi:DNA-binding XRE family transcriptional regulator